MTLPEVHVVAGAAEPAAELAVVIEAIRAAGLLAPRRRGCWPSVRARRC